MIHLRRVKEVPRGPEPRAKRINMYVSSSVLFFCFYIFVNKSTNYKYL
jgi:hypothetical protein